MTVYDFVRAFCALLVQGEGSSHAAAASPGGGGGVSVSVSLQAREEKKEELERLRVWAEDIADLASFGACVSVWRSILLPCWPSFAALTPTVLCRASQRKHLCLPLHPILVIYTLHVSSIVLF